MKSSLPAFLFAFLIAGCSYNEEKAIDRLKKDALSIAGKYAEGNVSSDVRRVFKEGITAIGDKEKMYIIDTAKIWTGLLDGDTKPDVIMTLDVYKNGYQDISEQLIMVSDNGKLRLSSSIESDMKIISLEGGKIIAEVPEHARNSPLFNCPACREVVTFLYSNGSLVKSQ
jgi:hypothetical protein